MVSSLTPLCDAHHGAWLCGVMHTAELVSAVKNTLRSSTQQWYTHSRVFQEILTIWLCGVMHTLELDSAVGCTLQSFLKIGIFRQNWNRIWKYFSLLVRGLNGFMNKNGGYKSCDTNPLRSSIWGQLRLEIRRVIYFKRFFIFSNIIHNFKYYNMCKTLIKVKI